MHRPLSVLLAILLGSALFAASAVAKGKTEKLTISGPGLTSPFVVTDPDAISVSAWSDDFFQFELGPSAAPSPTLPRYEIHFHIRPPRGGPLEMKYAVYFVIDTTADKALVYLPAPSDPLYRLNSAMIREGQEGNWYLASKTWSQALERALRRNSSL